MTKFFHTRICNGPYPTSARFEPYSVHAGACHGVAKVEDEELARVFDGLVKQFKFVTEITEEEYLKCKKVPGRNMDMVSTVESANQPKNPVKKQLLDSVVASRALPVSDGPTPEMLAKPVTDAPIDPANIRVGKVADGPPKKGK